MVKNKVFDLFSHKTTDSYKRNHEKIWNSTFYFVLNYCFTTVHVNIFSAIGKNPVFSFENPVLGFPTNFN